MSNIPRLSGPICVDAPVLAIQKMHSEVVGVWVEKDDGGAEKVTSVDMRTSLTASEEAGRDDEVSLSRSGQS